MTTRIIGMSAPGAPRPAEFATAKAATIDALTSAVVPPALMVLQDRAPTLDNWDEFIEVITSASASLFSSMLVSALHSSVRNGTLTKAPALKLIARAFAALGDCSREAKTPAQDAQRTLCADIDGGAA